MYELDKTYYNENGVEITILGKIGNRFVMAFGSCTINMVSFFNLNIVTQDWLDNQQLHLGTFHRNNCHCGYKATEPFGVQCPQCHETAGFYKLAEDFKNLPPLEDILG